MSGSIDRRALLALGGTAALTVGAVLAYPRLRPLAFEDVPGVPGLRRLAGSPGLSAISAATVGLGDTGPRIPAALRAEIAGDPVAVAHAASDAPVPVTLFTAGGCPFCEPQFQRLEGARPALRPLALFGSTSERAARAIIAAGADAWALHDRLVGTAFRTEDPFVRAVAADILGEARADALLARMDAPETTEALMRNHALASVLGIPGTPATLIGHTLAIGLTSRAVLDRIRAEEAARA